MRVSLDEPCATCGSGPGESCSVLEHDAGPIGLRDSGVFDRAELVAAAASLAPESGWCDPTPEQVVSDVRELLGPPCPEPVEQARRALVEPRTIGSGEGSRTCQRCGLFTRCRVRVCRPLSCGVPIAICPPCVADTGGRAFEFAVANHERRAHGRRYRPSRVPRRGVAQ